MNQEKQVKKQENENLTKPAKKWVT